MAGYFDITNSREENFADDLELDIAEDKSIMEERTIKLDGKINGHATGFYYNLRTGEFQMDDVVNFSERLFKVGKQNKGEKFTLPVKLPTLKEMRQTAKNTNIGEILETSDDLSGYEENLSGALDDTLAKDFSHTELNKYYIEKYNEKNLVMQESL